MHIVRTIYTFSILCVCFAPKDKINNKYLVTCSFNNQGTIKKADVKLGDRMMNPRVFCWKKKSCKMTVFFLLCALVIVVPATRYGTSCHTSTCTSTVTQARAPPTVQQANIKQDIWYLVERQNSSRYGKRQSLSYGESQLLSPPSEPQICSLFFRGNSISISSKAHALPKSGRPFLAMILALCSLAGWRQLWTMRTKAILGVWLLFVFWIEEKKRI